MNEPIVQTVEGLLRGCVRENLDGEEFYSFLGIPYMKAPVGDLRFLAPHPVEPWDGIREATVEGSPFLHKEKLITKSIFGSEDGLNLNVYTKKPIPSASLLKPVMVWIHGGGFVEGRNSSSLYGPEYLMTEDVVFVSINYRLGVFGFLSFEDPKLEIYGNAGMKDQVEALKWIQRNIRNFGGDPNNVTIFGESVGGASVHYLMMSPLAQGLFHKIIMQSGVATAFWGKGKRFVKDFLKFLGKEDLSESEALKYLRSLSARDLLYYQEKFLDNFPLRSLRIIAPIEELPNSTAFITKFPFNDLVSQTYNKLPILLGYNSNECISLGNSSHSYSTNLQKHDFNFSMLTKLTNKKFDERSLKLLNNQFRCIYPNEEDRYLMLSDWFVIMDTIMDARQHALASSQPVYLYRMSLDAGLNLFKRVMKLDHLKGTCHGDGLGYLFKTNLLPSPEKGTIEDISVRRFVKLWTNFAKYGNPTPEGSELNVKWEPFENEDEYYLDIDRELTLRKHPENERVEFWMKIKQADENGSVFIYNIIKNKY